MASYHLKKLKVYLPLWQRKIPKYPLYWKGNPQLRVFLPLFWMKIVKTERILPPGNVMFEVHLQMTKDDVKNYLEKIYKVPVDEVRTVIMRGAERKDPLRGFVIQPEDDKKMAYVQLGNNSTFKFPDMFHADKKTEDTKNVEEFKKMEKQMEADKQKNWDKNDVPSWFR